MTDAQPAEFLLDGYPVAIRETGRALRALVLATIPGSVETVRPGWRWIAYSLPEKGRVRNFAWIGPERHHIHLGFEHGTLLADPEHVLHGAEERLKKFRYFTFEPTIDIDEAVLVDYLQRAAELAVLPSGARRAPAGRSSRPAPSRSQQGTTCRPTGSSSSPRADAARASVGTPGLDARDRAYPSCARIAPGGYTVLWMLM
jgi:hypothetical protein